MSSTLPPLTSAACPSAPMAARPPVASCADDAPPPALTDAFEPGVVASTDGTTPAVASAAASPSDGVMASAASAWMDRTAASATSGLVGSLLHCLPCLCCATDDDERAGQLLNKMTVGPVGFGDRMTLLKAVRRLGLENFGKLAAGGVTIEVPNGWDEARAHRASYQPGSKRLCLATSRLDVDTAVHEMGHALDDCLEPDEPGKPLLRSDRDPVVQRLFTAYHERVEKSTWLDRLLSRGVWSEYAATNVYEYVAEGVMAYAGGGRARHRLERCDPDMARWVGGMLAGTPSVPGPSTPPPSA